MCGSRENYLVVVENLAKANVLERAKRAMSTCLGYEGRENGPQLYPGHQHPWQSYFDPQIQKGLGHQ